MLLCDLYARMMDLTGSYFRCSFKGLIMYLSKFQPVLDILHPWLFAPEECSGMLKIQFAIVHHLVPFDFGGTEPSFEPECAS